MAHPETFGEMWAALCGKFGTDEPEDLAKKTGIHGNTLRMWKANPGGRISKHGRAHFARLFPGDAAVSERHVADKEIAFPSRRNGDAAIAQLVEMCRTLNATLSSLRDDHQRISAEHREIIDAIRGSPSEGLRRRAR